MLELSWKQYLRTALVDDLRKTRDVERAEMEAAAETAARRVEREGRRAAEAAGPDGICLPLHTYNFDPLVWS